MEALNLTPVDIGFQATQLVQEQEQPPYVPLDSDVWGFFVPCSSAMARLDLKTSVVNIGRRFNNDIVLTEPIIS